MHKLYCNTYAVLTRGAFGAVAFFAGQRKAGALVISGTANPANSLLTHAKFATISILSAAANAANPQFLVTIHALKYI